MQNGAWNIRPAVIHDALAIAEVHVESRKSTYRGIFPEALLRGLSVKKRESFWRDSLAAHAPPAVTTLVGCEARGKIVAFVSGGKERTGQLGCDGEIYAVYLLQEAQRKGLGALPIVRHLRPSGLQAVVELDTIESAHRPKKCALADHTFEIETRSVSPPALRSSSSNRRSEPECADRPEVRICNRRKPETR